MTDLTEQWKKGKLPEGHYYVKDGDNMIAEYLDGYFYNNGEPMTSFSGGVDEVLEKVPSYEKWDKLNNTCHELEKETACLAVDIVNLKELLKECHSFIEDYDNKKLLTKIDEALK